MKKRIPASRSIARQFTRHFLIASIIPIIFLLLLIIIGNMITKNYLTDLITRSSYDLNKDAERNLQQLGEDIIITKARDVAKQAEIYFRAHPDIDITRMRKDDDFMTFAMQKVGKTGYTSIYEAGTWIFRVHPNRNLVDRNVDYLAPELPSWWALVGATHSGKEVYGYYDWRDTDGSIRKKFMCITPCRVKLQGRIMMVAATSYIDEFSLPVTNMRKKANDVVATYQRYVAQQILFFSLAAGVILLLSFWGIYAWGRRTGLRYITPITQLAQSARHLGEGNWNVLLPDSVLQRKDEIGVMAQSFFLMSQQLKDTFSSLEQRVLELKQTQDALKISEEHYRSLFDGIPVGLYRSTPEGKFVDANPMMIQMTGYPDRKAFLKINAQELYADQGVRADWQTQMKLQNDIHLREIRIKKFDHTEAWVEDQSRAVKDTAGSVLYYEGSIKDITKRVLADRALKTSEEKFRMLYDESRKAQEVYRSLINSSADAIVICNLEGNVTYVSPMFTAIFGWQATDLIDKPLPFIPASEKASNASAIAAVRETGHPCQGLETKRLTKDGRIIDVSLSASRYNDHVGNPAGLLMILRDISATKKMEEHLQQVERLEAIATLAGGIAHDFNNLLMVIQGTVSTMIYETHESDPRYKSLIAIEKQVNRGSRLTKQLLGYARKGKYDVRPLHLNEIIRESAEALRQTRKDIRIHYHLDPSLRPVEADAYQMEQVLMNLLINAADVMSAGGDMTLTTKNIPAVDIPEKLRENRTGNHILFTAEDTGIGMDKKTLDRIFEPFFTTKAINKGTGLGLASVYGIIRNHGGAVDVASTPGTGSKFFIYLPASIKEVPSKDTKQKKSLHGQGTILIIDDEKPVLDVTADMLTSMGYTPFKAGNGAQALEIFEHNYQQIDLVILDMIMPDISGMDIFNRLKAVHQDVAVLLASGYSLEGRAMEIMERGCDGFIQKPYSMEELSEKISGVLIKGGVGPE